MPAGPRRGTTRARLGLERVFAQPPWIVAAVTSGPYFGRPGGEAPGGPSSAAPGGPGAGDAA